MPVLQNSIGSSPTIYYFEDLRGAIELREEKLELFARFGIDGHGARKTGKRGELFTLTSHHYVSDWATARTALLAYKALVGLDPVEVVQHDVNYGTFLVVSVKEVPEETRACFNVIGSIVSNPEVKQVCQWTLLG